MRGYRDALADSQLSGEEFLLHCGFFSNDEGTLATKILMESGRDFTAVMYPDDFTAIAGLRELKKYGKSVPRDISVTGFDGISIGRLITPQLTTAVQNAKEIGKVAADMLIEKIGNSSATPKTVRLDTEIFIGESTRSVAGS